MNNLPYTAGTVSIPAGSATATGTGVVWTDARVQPWGFLTITATGQVFIVETIDSATGLTLANKNGGADITGAAYTIISFPSEMQDSLNIQAIRAFLATACLVVNGAAVSVWTKTAGTWSKIIDLASGGSTMIFPTDGAQWFVRFDRQRAAHPRQAMISALSVNMITLTANDSNLFFTDLMRGVSAVRLWNVSKSPPQPAWINGNPAADQLSVVAESMISAWTAGDVIQLGDVPGAPGVPDGFTSGYAIDVSQMLATQFGGIFRQKAMTFKSTVSGVGTPASMDASPSTANGSFSNGQSFPDGSFLTTEHMTVTSQLSPISDSNLIYVREVDVSGVGNLSTCGLACLGVWK